MGRPSDYTPELGDLICSLLASGKSLNSICASVEEIPSITTVINWLAKGEHKAEEFPEFAEFLAKYLRARETQADIIFDECLQIADNATDDIGFLTSEDNHGEGGKAVIKHSAIQRAKLQIDTRMRMAGKLKPKRYGDKTTTEVVGKDGGPVQITGIEVSFVGATPDSKG